MADPTFNLATPVAPLSTDIAISTTTTENILANKAGSGQIIRIDLLRVNNVDGGVSATISGWRYNQDGTGMNSNDGRNEVAIGSDVVAGSVIADCIPDALSIAAGGGQEIFNSQSPYYLHEDESLVIQASAANDLAITLTWTVIGA